MGFILGEYTIPSDLPIIYITDSNNARTLQRNVTDPGAFTHRKMIRNVKQGIDHAIANHLEYLTSKWPRMDQQSKHTRELYQRGEAICKKWATLNNDASSKRNFDDTSVVSLQSWDDDATSSESDTTDTTHPKDTPKNRYRFDSTMLDCLIDRVIIIKVFSHQLEKNFAVKTPGKTKNPNLYVVSGNQYADNAAGQAKKLFSAYDMCDGQYCYYPPFSPRWSFSFEGCLTTKGATKVWHEKLDDELILRQQLRSKQGLFLRMNSFNSLSTSQIGDESILRNLMKMTAMCWTRSVYRNPQLANHIWSFWRHSAHNAQIIDTLPVTIPKNWKKNPYICDDIIKACPFCSTFTGKNSKGNLEHLHIYCPSQHLQRVRSYCNQNWRKQYTNYMTMFPIENQIAQCKNATVCVHYKKI